MDRISSLLWKKCNIYVRILVNTGWNSIANTQQRQNMQKRICWKDTYYCKKGLHMAVYGQWIGELQ